MKKKILAGGAVIGAAAMILLVVWAFPLFQAAGAMRGIAEAKSVEFKIDVSFETERLSRNPQLLKAVSQVLGVDETSCASWNASGYMADKQGYAKIFCKGLQEPVTDVYFNPQQTVINVRMIYEALQENFTAQHPILGKLLPDWGYSDYVSLEQLEEIFQIDLKQSAGFDIPWELSQGSVLKSLAVLAKSERRKGENKGRQFVMDWNPYQVSLEAWKQQGTPKAYLRGEDTQDEQLIDRFAASLSGGMGEKPEFSESLMGQEEIEQFRELWDMVKGAI